MAEVWPLDLPQTDKLVLLALADSANDEDGRTWIAVDSRVKVNRFGRPKLDLLRKTGLSIRTVQGCVKRLEAAGHLTREENPGKGCDYWIHPVSPDADSETPAGDAGAQESASTPAGNAGGPRSSCGETISNRKQPARARGASRAAPAASPDRGEAKEPEKVLPPVDAQADEDERCKAIRAEIGKILKPSYWHLRPNGAISRCGMRLEELINGKLGLQVICAPGHRTSLEVERSLFESAALRCKLDIGWVDFSEGKVTRNA